MTHNTHDTPLPPPTPTAPTQAAGPARKRAAKPSAVKAAVPPPPPAKKTARKAASTTTRAKRATPSIPKINTVEAIRNDPSVDVIPNDPSPVTPAPAAKTRIGRVPGGGAVSPRKAPAASPPQMTEAAHETRQETPQEATPAPAPTPAPTPAVRMEVADTPPPSTGALQKAAGTQEAPTYPPPAPSHAPQQPHHHTASNNESRSKRRREKRKKQHHQGPTRHHHQKPSEGGPNGSAPEAARLFLPVGPKVEANGMLELAPKGFGFLRVPKKNFEQGRDDVFVSPELIRSHNLRNAQWIHGLYQEGPRGPQLVEINQVNGITPEEAAKLPHFDELKAINPTKRLSFETTPERFTTRVIDIMTPVGRGQRGLIVSPPRSGKTTMLLHTAQAVQEKYEDSLHLMVLLVDERPEEVTEFRRSLPGAEIYASSNDEVARNHCRIAELAIERAKRLVEAGKDVFLLMDSITRLARAYNATMNHVGRGTGSGGITIGALEVPRRLFAAARNTRGAGSLTILATALIQTNSRADEAIFLEFKGTGNMELVLDRKIAENYIYPAVDIFKSGTRREELLLPEHMLHKIHLIRRGLSGHRPVEAMERLLFFLKKFSNNPQMLLEIKG